MILQHPKPLPAPPAKLVTSISTSIALLTKSKKTYVTADLVANNTVARAEIWIKFPAQVYAICSYPESSKNRPDTWKFHLSKYGLLAVDPVRQWYWRSLSPSLKAQKTLYNQFITDLPPPARIIVSPGSALTLFDQVLKLNSGWKSVVTSTNLVWTGTSKVGNVTLSFDRKTKLLHEFTERLQLKSGKFDVAQWQFHYHKWVNPADLVAPSNFISTGLFSVAAAYPNYGIGKASELAKRSVQFYDHHHNIEIQSITASNNFTVTMTNGNIQVQGQGYSWTFGHGYFGCKVGTKATKQPLALEQLPEELLKRNLPVTRLILTLVSGHNFAERSFLAGYEGQLVGQLQLDGRKVDLVQLRGPAVQVMLSVDDATGFIDELESTTYDSEGKPLSKQDIRFKLLSPKY